MNPYIKHMYEFIVLIIYNHIEEITYFNEKQWCQYHINDFPFDFTALFILSSFCPITLTSLVGDLIVFLLVYKTRIAF